MPSRFHEPQLRSIDDQNAIEHLIRSQFGAMRWDAGGDADWISFQSGYMPHAQLYAAARPARSQSVSEFVERMRGLAANGKLRTFSERPLGVRVMIYGNVAIALAGCEMLENGEDITRDASAYLLVKDGPAWRVAGQAWDVESENNRLPPGIAWVIIVPPGRWTSGGPDLQFGSRQQSEPRRCSC